METELPPSDPWADSSPVEAPPRSPVMAPPATPVEAPPRPSAQAPPRTPPAPPASAGAPLEGPRSRSAAAGFSIGAAGRAFDEVEALLGDPSDPPDTMLDGGSLADVTVLAASVRGLSHRQKGTARQDSYGLAVSRDQRWLVAVVADGVGAGRLSHRAAQVATRTGAARVVALVDQGTHPDSLDWYAVFSDVAGRIVGAGVKLLGQDASAQGDGQAAAVAREMGTTATFLVCETSPAGPRRQVYLAWMGDSPVWVVDEGRWHCLTEVKNAGREVASSSVAALPHLPGDPRRLPLGRHDVPVTACLLVMSDGVGDPLGEGRGEVARVLGDEWARPPALLRFAEHVAFGRKSYDDDRTVVGIWPRGAP